MPQTPTQLPFSINIFWQPAGEEGNEELRKYADLLYGFFNRNTTDPLDRYLEIPVFLHPLPPGSPEELQLAHCLYSANIFLIDDEMLMASPWQEFAGKLANHISGLGPAHRIIPVGFTENFPRLHDRISTIQGVQLLEVEEERRLYHLLINLSHQICRQLYNQLPPGQPLSHLPPLPIQLFISHAKMDGDKAAAALDNHIKTHSSLGTFFDSVNMATGWSFPEQIEAHVSQSVLLAIHTDKYSSREWCRREVLLAKKHNCPVLVVNRFRKGELRSFPYIGNVPHIHYEEEIKDDKQRGRFFDYVLVQALRETLRFKYYELRMKMQAKWFGVEPLKIISYPPELVSLAHLEEEEGLVLYPDPPLGPEELSLLATFRPKLSFLTPTMLPLLAQSGSYYKSLSPLKVGISLSEPLMGPLAEYQNRGIQDLMVGITKYLLAVGATLVYSGNLKYDEAEEGAEKFNYIRLLIDLLRTYQQTYGLLRKEALKPMKNYTFFPLSQILSKGDRAGLLGLVDFIDVEAPEELKLKKSDAKEMLAFRSFDHKYVWAKSISRMREKMIGEVGAQIVLGGKWVKFKGKMPGVLEEVLIAMKQQQPVYPVGGFGGVAKGVADALQGKAPEGLSQAFYQREDEERANFIHEFNGHRLTLPEEKVDFSLILKFLNETGQGRSDFGLHNGLSREENLRLFHSRYDIEIISLILKGLKTMATP